MLTSKELAYSRDLPALLWPDYALKSPPPRRSPQSRTARASVERYLYDPLGNVQALDANGAYRTLWNTSGYGDDALGEYYVRPPANFVGADSSGLSGTVFGWRF